MADRHDIDALLIGSLYGELSSADEARLKAHLESHPADRIALDGLERARDAVRASRIFEVQAEPRQAVSALLLQEAARRAPRKASQGEGWFERLRRSFLMSPAFAAAAMLVVVAGVAGTIYMRKGDHFAAPEVAAPAQHAAAADYESEEAPAGAAPAAQAAGSGFAAAPATPPPPPAAVVADLAGDERRDGEAAYRVGLVEGKDSRPAEPQAKPADTAVAAAQSEAKAKAEALTVARQAGPRGMLEVSTPARAPKELDDAPPVKAAKGRAQRREEAEPDEVVAAAEPASAGKLGNAPMPAVRAPSAAPAPAPSVAQDFSRAPAAPATGGAMGGAAAPGGAAEEKIGAVDADVAWAREQHARLVTQVKAGRCGDAAGTAVALSTRAPGYYQQNVENDRAVKSCLAYINAERERAADKAQRARATTRRMTDEDAAASKRAAAPRPVTPAKPTPAKSAPAKADAAKDEAPVKRN